MCQGRSTPYSGDKLIDLPPLMTGLLIMSIYKPLRTWADDFPIPYYMEIHGS